MDLKNQHITENNSIITANYNSIICSLLSNEENFKCYREEKMPKNQGCINWAVSFWQTVIILEHEGLLILPHHRYEIPRVFQDRLWHCKTLDTTQLWLRMRYAPAHRATYHCLMGQSPREQSTAILSHHSRINTQFVILN